MRGKKSRKNAKGESNRLDANSESFNTSTSKRMLVTWATYLTLVLGGGSMTFLPLMKPKVAAAQFETAKNKVGNDIADLKEIFKTQKGIAEQRVPAFHETVQKLIKDIEAYNKNASEKIKIKGKNDKAKIKTLNESLGVKVKGKTPNYVTYETIDKLETEMLYINTATTFGSDMDDVGKHAGSLIAEVKKEPPKGAAKEIITEEPYEEVTVEEVKVEAPDKSKFDEMSELEKVNFYLETLDVLKKVVTKPSKPKKVKKPGKKASDEVKAEYAEKKTQYDDAKEEYNERLAAYKKLNSKYKTLSAAKKKLKKGNTLNTQQQKAVDEGLAFVQGQLETAAYILSGTTVTNIMKAGYMAHVNAGTYENLKEASTILRAEINTLVSYINQEIKIHEKKANNEITKVLGKKYKVDYRKEAKKLGYDLTTVGGSLKMLDWVYHNDNEIYYKILQSEADKLSLSTTEAEAAVGEIAGIRALRAQIWHEKKTAQSFQGGKAALETAIESAEKTFETVDPVLETARALLEAEEITYSNMYYEAALGLLAIQEAQIWYNTDEINNVNETNRDEVEDNLDTAKEAYLWNFGEYQQPIDMSISRKLAYHAIHEMTSETLSKYEMHVYHKGEPGAVKGTDAVEWEAGIKGSLVYKATVFAPIYGHFLTTILTEGGVYPYYIRGVEPGYADYETNEVLKYSPYGFTVGEVERQRVHLPAEDWESYNEVLSKIPEGYGWISKEKSDFAKKIKTPAMGVINDLKDAKLTDLDESIPQYNQGLAKAGEVKKEDGTTVEVYAPVTVELLNLFGEGKKNKDYKTEKGKIVSAKEGEVLKSAKYVKSFYTFWENMSSEQKMKDLTIDVLKNTLLPLRKDLENNLTEEAKKDPSIAYLLENIPKITSRKQAEKAMEELRKTPLWIGTYYKFETPEDEKRYEVAATVSELLHTKKKNSFSKLHQIALAELAAVEAKAIKKTIYGEEEKIKIEEEIPKEIEVMPLSEPMPMGIIEELGTLQSFSELPIIKGSGDKWFISPEGLELPSTFLTKVGNDETKAYETASEIAKGMYALNNPEINDVTAAQNLAESLERLIESDYLETDPDIQGALRLLRGGNLREGLTALEAAEGFSAAYENLSKFYSMELDETGITYMGVGTVQRIQFEGASQKLLAAMQGEELSTAFIYGIDLTYKYVQAQNIPVAFHEMKYSSEWDVLAGLYESTVGTGPSSGMTIDNLKTELLNRGVTDEAIKKEIADKKYQTMPSGEWINGAYVPKVAGGFGEMNKHTFGAALNWAAPTVKSTQEYFGNVWTGTFLVRFSHDTFEALGVDEHPDKAGLLDPKTIKMKGKKFSLDFIGLEFRFPAIKKKVKIESIKAGAVNVVTADLIKKDEAAFKPKETAAFNPLISTTLTVDAVDTDHFTFQIYGTPSLLVYMGDPKFIGEIGLRTITYKDNHALLLQAGTEMVYPATTGNEIAIKPIKGALVWHTPIGITLSLSAWAHYADNKMGTTMGPEYKTLTPGGELMITLRPGEWATMAKEKKKKKAEKAKKKAEEEAKKAKEEAE